MSDAKRGMQGRARTLALVLAGLLALALPIVLRAWLEGRAALASALQTHDQEAAIVELGRAARWRVPLADHDERARARLEAIADTAEQAGDLELALVAWRELRGALLGTRSLALADPDQLARANAGIVRGMVAEAHASGRPDARERWQAELDAAPARDTLASRVAALLFVLWLASLIGFVLRGLDADGRLIARHGIAWAAVSLALLLAWILVM
jgi:hypothetical protein